MTGQLPGTGNWPRKLLDPDSQFNLFRLENRRSPKERFERNDAKSPQLLLDASHRLDNEAPKLT